jgi:hypothetical protein
VAIEGGGTKVDGERVGCGGMCGFKLRSACVNCFRNLFSTFQILESYVKHSFHSPTNASVKICNHKFLDVSARYFEEWKEMQDPTPQPGSTYTVKPSHQRVTGVRQMER